MRVMLTIEDLAAILSTSPAAIRNARYRGADLPPAVRFGRSLRWDPTDVEAWIAARKEPGNSNGGPESLGTAVAGDDAPTSTANGPVRRGRR